MEKGEFYEKYKDMYPVINTKVYVHQSKEDNKIIGYMNQSELKYTFESCNLNEINDDAVFILKICDGTKKLKQVIDFISKNKNLDFDNARDIICLFLDKAINMNYIKMESDICNYLPLEITGSKETYYPIHFVLELTTKCNLKCKHCYRSADSNIKETELVYEEVIKVIDEMYNSGARFIELTGGEVMMHPNCKEIILYVCQKFYFVGILTNGVLLKEDFIEELEQYKNVLIWSISLDSYREEFHNSFRGSSIAYENTTNAIRILRKHGHLVRVSMSVVEGNFFDIEDTLEYAKNKLDATWFGYNMVMPYGRGKDLEWDMDSEVMMKRSVEIDENSLMYEKKYPGFLNVYSQELLEKISKKEGNCGAGWRTIVISSSGNIRPCVMGDEKYIVMGNILKDGIKRIVDSGKTMLLRNLKWPEKENCGSCKNSGFCNKCPLRAYISNEERIRQKLELCQWAKDNRIIEYINLTPMDEPQSSGCLYNICNDK